jgi:hypothetical protein
MGYLLILSEEKHIYYSLSDIHVLRLVEAASK